MSLADVREELIDALQDQLSVLAARPPLVAAGDVVEDAWRCFEGLGCANLLLSADLQRFRVNLVYAAGARRWFLTHAAAAGLADDLHLAISRTDAVFDALAAAAPALARDVVGRSPHVWIPDGEYEDDFCYYAFVHGLVRDPSVAAPTPLRALLDRFEQVLAGAPSPRLAVCRALLGRDSAAFVAAFEALLAVREAEVAEQTLSDDPAAEPRRRVFVEGLALLRIADDRGLATATGIARCPDIARRVVGGPLPDDIWARLDAEFPR